MDKLTIADLENYLAGGVLALRSVVTLQPVGGQGAVTLPPTYEEGTHCIGKTVRENGDVEDTIQLDSPASQANRCEQALLRAYRNGVIEDLSHFAVTFCEGHPLHGTEFTTLDLSHRIADASIRASKVPEEGVTFEKSSLGQKLVDATPNDLTFLLEYDPTSIVHGIWNSYQKAHGIKVRRYLTSDIMAYGFKMMQVSASRIDPMPVIKAAGPIYERAGDDPTCPPWTLDPAEAKVGTETSRKGKKGKTTKKGEPILYGESAKAGSPASAIIGNITPTLSDGGITFKYAMQRSILSLPVIRGWGFKIDGQTNPEATKAARLLITTLAILGVTLDRDDNLFLRARCHLCPVEDYRWEVVRSGKPTEPVYHTVTVEDAIDLWKQAVEKAKAAGFRFAGRTVLQATDALKKLTKKSIDLSGPAGGDAEAD